MLPAIVYKVFWGALLFIIGHIVFKVLVSLGVAVVTYYGVSTAIDWMMARALAELRGLPAEMVGLLAYMQVGVCLSMLSSAIAMRAALNFNAVDTIKRLVIGGA